MAAYLVQIELALRESGIDKREWCMKLMPRLTPKLAEGVRLRMEAGTSYDEVRGFLMECAGTTVAVYGHQLFALNIESIRRMKSSQQAINHLTRIVQGLISGCQ